jgi:hypothetical protein
VPASYRRCTAAAVRPSLGLPIQPQPYGKTPTAVFTQIRRLADIITDWFWVTILYEQNCVEQSLPYDSLDIASTISACCSAWLSALARERHPIQDRPFHPNKQKSDITSQKKAKTKTNKPVLKSM